MNAVPDQEESPLADLEIEDQVHEFTREELGPDELYDLRRELHDMGEEPLAIRVDIEYRNSLRYDDYWPAFGPQNLVSILMMLGNIKYNHAAAGNRRRSDITGDLADTIANEFRRWSDEHDVPLEQYIGIGMSDDDVERDHSDRMRRAKHGDGEETEGPEDIVDDALDELTGPSAVEEKEIHPQPQTPDEPDSPGPGSPDDPEAG